MTEEPESRTSYRGQQQIHRRSMKVMLDTNVLISALKSGVGTCADVLRAVLATHHLAVGSTVLEECERVLVEKMKLPAPRAREAVASIAHQAEVIQPTGPATWPLRDADDRWVVAAALAGKVDVLITGDDDILDEPQTELRTLSPRQFLDRGRQGGRWVS